MNTTKGTWPEVLAPAGDEERLRAALLYGADAVYLAGKRYGMRSAAPNFGDTELAGAVRLAHDAGARAYVTCNILPRPDELQALPAYLETVQAAGADALIVADLGVMALAQRHAPQCALHMSTQFGVTNHESARRLYELGASRVVLARELSLEEIAAIRAKTPPELELEAFVHGAMCMSWSGRCLLSAFLTGRDANHGDCAQPCRWRFEVNRPGEPDRRMTLDQEDTGSFLFNANDLCMIEHVAALAQAGIDSFKIEGRAKAAYYAAVITNAYRVAVDGYAASHGDPAYCPPAWVREETEKVSHRPYGTGFYFSQPAQETRFGGYLRTWEVAAVVTGYEDGCLLLRQRNRFFIGDTLEVLEPHQPPFTLTVRTLADGNGTPLEAASHADECLRLPFERPLVPGSLLRQKREEALREPR